MPFIFICINYFVTVAGHLQIFITLWKHSETIFMLIKVPRLKSANISKCLIIIDFTIEENLLAEVIFFCYVINVRIHSNSIFFIICVDFTYNIFKARKKYY